MEVNNGISQNHLISFGEVLSKEKKMFKGNRFLTVLFIKADDEQWMKKSQISLTFCCCCCCCCFDAFGLIP